MRESEARLRERTDLLQNITDHMFDLVAIVDLDGVYTYAGPSHRSLGYEPERLVGTCGFDNVHPDDAPRVREAFEEFAAHSAPGTTRTVTYRHRCADGTDRWLESRAKILFRDGGAPFAVFLSSRDITESKDAAEELDEHRHRLEELVEARTQELAQASERAEAASRAKSAFLANMSHEIRTPINAVVGLTHLLQRDEPSPVQRERLRKIESSTSHLLSIVSDILDMAKIEAGRLVIEEHDFPLSAVLDHVGAMLAEEAQKKGLRLEIDRDDVPSWLRGDSLRLRQALLNLAGNAVKFTREGFVALRTVLLEADDAGLRVRFEVEDSGVGIASDRLPVLFDAFEQIDPSVTREHGGTGLGLAITRRLVESMGGEVGVESEPGRGTRVWFVVRLQRGHAVVPEVGEPWDEHDEVGPLAGARVLLAEDNAINREVALELLRGFGLDVSEAQNGRVAVDLARGGAFDLVLMDVQMPVLDGLSATREIRRLPGYAGVPVLAMTANVFEDDRIACLEAGMDGFVAKPVEPSALRSAVAEWLQRGRRAVDGAAFDVSTTVEGALRATDVRAGADSGPPAGAASRAWDAFEPGLPAPLRWPGLEPSTALEAVGGRASLIRFLRRLVAEHAGDVGDLGAELAAGEVAATAGRAHRLKGAAGTLGAVAVQRAAAELEAAVRGGRSEPARLVELAATLASEFEDLRRRLAQVSDEEHVV